MITTKNLTHEFYGEDRIYILWDHSRGEDGQILDPDKEIQNYVDSITDMYEDFYIVDSRDDAVASHYGYDNCIILGND